MKGRVSDQYMKAYAVFQKAKNAAWEAFDKKEPHSYEKAMNERNAAIAAATLAYEKAMGLSY